jgi:hypothetical protein
VPRRVDAGGRCRRLAVEARAGGRATAGGAHRVSPGTARRAGAGSWVGPPGLRPGVRFIRSAIRSRASARRR